MLGRGALGLFMRRAALRSYPALRRTSAQTAFFSTPAAEEAAVDGGAEGAEAEGDAVEAGTIKGKSDFKKFKQREHVEFLAAPHWKTPDPEFMRQYHVLYCLLAFLVRARRNARYARFLRVLRTERVAVAEALPGHLGAMQLGTEVMRLTRLKHRALADAARADLRTIDPELGKLRSLLDREAGDPQADPSAYRNLYHNLVLTLHNYDTTRMMDQWRPGRQGRLVPTRPPRPPRPLPADFIPAKEPPLPFLFAHGRVTMLDPKTMAQDEDGQDVNDSPRAFGSGPTTRHRVLGTLPNVMPRRQLVDYYRQYQKQKEEGTLPKHLEDDPYRAMRGFCAHWVTWTLRRQREIAHGQRLAFAGTVELAGRMVRYHQGLGLSKLLGGVTAVQRTGDLSQGLMQYRAALMRFYEHTLKKHIGYSDEVRRMLVGITSSTPPTPMELVDAVWKSVFLSKEGIFNWRMNELRRQFIRKRAEKRAAEQHPRRTALARRNEHRYLRHYYLIKTILSMSVVGKPPTAHPSRLLGLLRSRLLALLYEMLLPAARLTHRSAAAQTLGVPPTDVQWRTVVKRLGHTYDPVAPPSGPRRVVLPKGEIETNRRLVDRYPIHGTNSAVYLRQLQEYRRNHLLRTRALALNYTPRGPVAPPPAPSATATAAAAP